MHQIAMLRRSVRSAGFTLVELLIVIIVITVIAAIAIPKFMDSGERAKLAAQQADLKLLRNAVTTFQNDTGAYPADLDDLNATNSPATGLSSAGTSKGIKAADYRGPYLTEVPNDPVTGSPFTYVKNPASGPVGTVAAPPTTGDAGGPTLD